MILRPYRTNPKRSLPHLRSRFSRAALSGMVLAFAMVASPEDVASQGRQSSDPDTLQTYRLPGIVVAPRRATLSAGGASVIRMSLDSIGMAPTLSLSEVLRSTPLIRVQTNSRGEEQPSMRGAGSRQLGVLLDGVPLTLGWDHRTDLSLVPMQGATDLSLHRGLSSLLFGPNMLGGVVEISMAGGAASPGPSRAPSGTSSPSGLVGQASASWEGQGAWRLDASGTAGFVTGRTDWTVRSGAGMRRSPGDRLAEGARSHAGLDEAFLADPDGLRMNSDMERIQGFLALRGDGTDGGWASLSASGHSTSRGVTPEAHTTEPRLWRYPDQDQLFLSVSGGKERAEESAVPASISATLGLRVGTTELEAFEETEYVTPTRRQIDEDRTVTMRVANRYGSSDRFVLRSSLTLADVHHSEATDGGPPDRFQQELWSAGAEIELPIGPPGGAFAPRFGAGLVMDGARTPEAGPWEPVPGVNAWGGRAGVSSIIGESGRFVAHSSVSRRARIPSLREMYSGALGRFLPNPDLRPEIQLAGEVGGTATLGNAEMQGVLFMQNVDDGIVRVSVEHEGGRILQRVNRDQVRATGVELLSSLNLDGVDLQADLTLQRVRLSTGGDDRSTRPEYEPAVRGSLNISSSPARLFGGEESSGDPGFAGVVGDPALWASLRYEGAQYCLDPALGEMERMASSNPIDLGVDVPVSLEWTPIRGMTLGLRVTNVADALSFDQCGLPRPGRTLQLSIRTR